MEILYYGACWPTNIGNAFIDLGSIQSLKMAVPDAHIYFVSELPTWMFSRLKHRENVFSLAKYVNCDYVVVSGMNCCEAFIQTEGEVIKCLSDKGVKVVFNGGGQRTYDDVERQNFKSFLKQINLVAFISRDSVTYDNFADVAPASFDGVDCAFFLPEAYHVPKMNIEDFVILNFDSSLKDMSIVTDKKIINLHHSMWPAIPQNHIQDKECLISDVPYDYLSLYGNTSATYSDRVHACIATLAYGNAARLYSNTQRGNLFRRIGVGEISHKLTHVNMTYLQKLKNDHIEFLRTHLK